MATTDYNKLKEISPTSTNDSGATVDKAQPVLITSKNIDGFEDGDYTSNPIWSEAGNTTDASWSVQSTTVKNGSNSLEINTSSAPNSASYLDHNGSISIDDGDTFTTWMRLDVDDTLAYILNTEASSTTGNDTVRVNFEDNQVAVFTYDSSGNFIGESSSISLTSGNWYKVELSFDTANNDVTLTIYDSSDSQVGSATQSYSGATSYSYITLGKYNDATGSGYFDDVQYNYNDDSETGTGDIVLDWTNISSESDLAVYDQNGNLLPYEIESFDSTAETATLWAYDSWVRDDTVQAQVVYGDGPSSSEENVTGTWNNTGQNAVMVQHLNGDVIDSTSNNHDGTVNGATSGATGQFAEGYSFDGADDYIDTSFSNDPFGNDTFTIITWINPDDTTNNRDFVSRVSGFGDGQGQMKIGYSGNLEAGNPLQLALTDDDDSTITADADGVTSTGILQQVIADYDSTTPRMFVDGSEVSYQSQATGNGLQPETSRDMRIGARLDDSFYYDGIIDEVRVYSDIKSQAWKTADYDASPRAGQVFFSQQAAEDTVTDKTASIPETQLTSDNPTPALNATNQVTITETQLTETQSDPTVSPGTAPITITETQITETTPDISLAPGSTRVQTEVTLLNSTNPDFTVNATNEVTVPETQLTETNPDLAVAEGSTILAPETQLTQTTESPTITPGTAQIQVTETQLTQTNPEVSLNRKVLIGIETQLTSSNPEPGINAGSVSVTVSETTLTITEPDIQLTPGLSTVNASNPTRLTTDNPEFTVTGGATTLSVDTTELSSQTQNPSVVITLPDGSNIELGISAKSRYRLDLNAK